MNLENKKQIATLLLAVALGLAAAVFTSDYVTKSINKQTTALAKNYDKKTEEIKKELALTQKALDQLAKNQKVLADRPAQVAAGGPERQMTPAGVLSARTPPGKRALTINVDTLSAVGGLLNPGDRVDIIADLQIPDSRDPKAEPDKVTSVLFQDVLVLAVGTNFQPVTTAEGYDARAKARSLQITLALDPEEASLITFSQKYGKMQLTLRPPSDEGVQNMEVASWDSLADFVLERQGTELIVPRSKARIQTDDTGKKETKDTEAFIQIFKGGKEQ
jgi:Flp pilus assembly protein CpaB